MEIVVMLLFFIVMSTGLITILVGVPIILERFMDKIFEKIRRRKKHV